MTDENQLEGQSRRKFIKTSAAVGAAAATGVAAFGGQAAAQAEQSQGDVIQDLTATIEQQGTQEGLVNVLVQAAVVDAVDVQNVQVQVSEVLENVNVEVLEGGITIQDVNVNATVVVQALNAGGQVVDTATTQITG